MKTNKDFIKEIDNMDNRAKSDSKETSDSVNKLERLISTMFFVIYMLLGFAAISTINMMFIEITPVLTFNFLVVCSLMIFSVLGLYIVIDHMGNKKELKTIDLEVIDLLNRKDKHIDEEIRGKFQYLMNEMKDVHGVLREYSKTYDSIRSRQMQHSKSISVLENQLKQLLERI